MSPVVDFRKPAPPPQADQEADRPRDQIAGLAVKVMALALATALLDLLEKYPDLGSFSFRQALAELLEDRP